MKQDRLDSCVLLHYHKTLTDKMDQNVIAKTFSSENRRATKNNGEQRRGHFDHFDLPYFGFGKIRRIVTHGLNPHPPSPETIVLT